MHDHILVYAKQRKSLRFKGWNIDFLPRSDEQNYKNPDNDLKENEILQHYSQKDAERLNITQ
jgi:hypothetical protein